MKINVTFKTPDAVDFVVDREVEHELREKGQWDKYEWECRSDEIKEKLSKWVQYGEFVTLEFDTDAGTVRVKEV